MFLRLLRYQGYIGAALVLGGVDCNGPHLYSIYPHGSTDKLPYVTMGQYQPPHCCTGTRSKPGQHMCVNTGNRVQNRCYTEPVCINTELQSLGGTAFKTVLTAAGVSRCSLWFCSSAGGSSVIIDLFYFTIVKVFRSNQNQLIRSRSFKKKKGWTSQMSFRCDWCRWFHLVTQLLGQFDDAVVL